MPRNDRSPLSKRSPGRTRSSGGPSLPAARSLHAHLRRSLRHPELPPESIADELDSSASPTSIFSPAAAAAMTLLLGVGISLTILGIMRRFAAMDGASGVPQSAVIGGSLLALAVGVQAPHRLAMWICAAAWRRFLLRGRTSDISTPAIARGAVDRPLHWVLLSVVALLAGVATALTPLSVQAAAYAGDWVLAQFLWNPITLALLHVAIAMAAALPPLALFGIAATSSHHLLCRYGQWDTRAAAWLVIGAGAGVWLARLIAGWAGQTDLTLMAAALPALLVALLSASSIASRASAHHTEGMADSALLPIWSDRWPTLLRASIGAATIAGACVMWVFVQESARTFTQPHTATSGLLLALGTGLMVGCRRGRSGLRSIGGFGAACAAAGATLLVSPIGPNHLAVLASSTPMIGACLSVAVIGFAIAYGHQALLGRVASRSSVGATTLARTLATSAIVLWIGAPLLVMLLGASTTLIAVALGLLALGGTLIIHEPDYVRRSRRLRLGAIFLFIGVIIGWSLLGKG